MEKKEGNPRTIGVMVDVMWRETIADVKVESFFKDGLQLFHSF